MKKNIALLLTLCLCMSVFAGCSQNSGSETAVPKVENNPSAETTVPAVCRLAWACQPDFTFGFEIIQIFN